MTPDSLESWLSYLEGLHPVEIDLGLERIRSVADTLGLLHPDAAVITVAGTNGKGSTCALLNAILTAAGYRVGVYSSPHLQRYNERIVVDDVEASDAQLIASFAAIESARNVTSLSYFEFATLAALDVFNRAEVDVIVLEVGLGGRLDAVNIIDPDVAVVTTISVDHEQWLGSDVDVIGQEKAGIFRPRRPAIYGDGCINRGVISYAQKVGATLYRRGIDFDVELSVDSWSLTGIDSTSKRQCYNNLPYPSLPLDNAATAIFSLMQSSIDIPEDAMREGLQKAFLKGRFQSLVVNNQAGEAITVLLDVAHNPQSAAMLKNNLQATASSGNSLCVIAMLDDKDVGGVLDELVSVSDKWFVTQCRTPRACSATRLRDELRRLGCEFVTTCSSVGEALSAAINAATANDRVVVAGSFFTVADALEMIDNRKDTAV